MATEIAVAVSFITSYLYNKLPRRRVDMFAEELQKNLAKKLGDCWTPEQPDMGRPQRCLRVAGRAGFDPLLLVTATDCGLDMQEIVQCLPADLVIWIDPKEVSYRFGEKDAMQTLYSEKLDRDAAPKQFQFSPTTLSPAAAGMHMAPQQAVVSATTLTDPFTAVRPSTKDAAALFGADLDDVQSRMAVLAFATSCSSPQPVSPTAPLCLPPSSPHAAGPPPSAPVTSSSSAAAGQKSPSTPSFTAASFAQTKFGSVKLRMQNRRPPMITAADLARHQRAYSSNSATSPKPAPSLNASLPTHTAAAWLGAQHNAKQLVAMQHQLSANSLKATSPVGTQLPRSETSPIPQLKSPYDAAHSDLALARKLALANANGLPGSAVLREQSESVDSAQLSAMYNMYQSRFMLNHLLSESAEEQPPLLAPDYGLPYPYPHDRLDFGAAAAHAQLAAHLGLGAAGDALNGATASALAASSLQLSPGQHSDSSKSNKDEYGADAGTGATRSTQHLLLAS